MSPIPLARTADVRTAIYSRLATYTVVEETMGLSKKDDNEILADIDEARYGPLPRRIDAMGARKPSGRVYVLHNVLVPPHTMGWSLDLKDGITVYFPRVCGNLSVNYPSSIKHAKPIGIVSEKATPQVVSFAPQEKITTPGYVTVSPVGNAGDVNVIPVQEVQPQVSAEHGKFNYGWFAPLIAPIIDWASHGSSPTVAPCSVGSNENGVCQR